MINIKKLPGKGVKKIETIGVLEIILKYDYVLLNNDVKLAEITPKEHFFKNGRYENRKISLLFDEDYLNSFRGEKKLTNIHYSDYFFDSENISILPNKWLCLDYLKKNNRCEDVTPQGIIRDIYLGKIKNITPLFDTDFYLTQVNMAGVSLDRPPFLHYIYFGWKLGFDPHPLFDTWYLTECHGLDARTPPLLWYFDQQHKLENKYISPSPFVDLPHLNHQIVSLATEIDRNLTQLEAVLADGSTCPTCYLNPNLNSAVISYLSRVLDWGIAIDNPNKNISDFLQILKKLKFHKTEVYEKNKIEISIIIVNYHKFIITLLSIFSVISSIKNTSYEIILIDNDSNPFECEMLYRYCASVKNLKIITTDKNLFFGEANNIGIDRATGEFTLFLNNDAFINKRVFDDLYEKVSQNSNFGAIGPVMFNSSLNILEFGGCVSEFGDITQRLKGMLLDEDLQIKLATIGTSLVDYVSAACLLVRTSILKKHGGYDYIYEPFYYEDTDMCLRIKSLGHAIAASGNSFCLHLENTTTKEYLAHSFASVVQRSMNQFRLRWSRFDKIDNGITRCDFIQTIDSNWTTNSDKKHIAIYTPFGVNIGGGENYIFSVAAALSEHYHVTVITDSMVSASRFGWVFRDLGIVSNELMIKTVNEIAYCNFDLGIVMGNEITPPWLPNAKRIIYHCQFPFPLHHVKNFDLSRQKNISAYLVNSSYTKREIESQIEKYKLCTHPVLIQAPPCDISTHTMRDIFVAKTENTELKRFVSVGRYFTGGHCKNQEIIARTFNALINKGITNFSTFLYGGLSTNQEDVDYFNVVSALNCEGKILALANVPKQKINNTYLYSNYYIHAAGLNSNVSVLPHTAEHFGITVIEAMSHGCIPIVFSIGGPAEIVADAEVGYTYSSEEELLKILEQLTLIKQSKSECKAEIEKCISYSKRYSRKIFSRNIVELANSFVA